MKKINQSHCYFIIILLTILFQSCEEWIEPDFPDSQLGTVQVFEDVQTARAAIAGLCASLRDHSVISGNAIGTGALLGSYTDDLTCFYEDNNGYTDLYQNQQLATNTTIARLWDLSYQQIYAANSIVVGLDNSISLSPEEKDVLKGEAIFIRSLIYFYLQRIFGKIPYTTELDYEYNSHLHKLSEEELLTQLISDLGEANALLKDDYRNYERIYPNRKTSELLLAKVYLELGNWSQAEDLANNIIQSGLYSFQSDINEVFHNSGTHILWQFQTPYPGATTEEASLYYFEESTPLSYALTNNLLTAFEENDLRLQTWITPVTFNGFTWYRNSKYKNIEGANTNEYSIVFRLAEVYFVMAESLARQGRTEEALPYLNAIRQRAGLPTLTTMPQSEFLQMVLLEKRREFFAESGHRFFDLKRFGQLNSLSSLKPNWKPFHRVWPLPQKELLLNENLKPQNEGY